MEAGLEGEASPVVAATTSSVPSSFSRGASSSEAEEEVGKASLGLTGAEDIASAEEAAGVVASPAGAASSIMSSSGEPLAATGATVADEAAGAAEAACAGAAAAGVDDGAFAAIAGTLRVTPNLAQRP